MSLGGSGGKGGHQPGEVGRGGGALAAFPPSPPPPPGPPPALHNGADKGRACWSPFVIQRGAGGPPPLGLSCQPGPPPAGGYAVRGGGGGGLRASVSPRNGGALSPPSSPGCAWETRGCTLGVLGRELRRLGPPWHSTPMSRLGSPSSCSPLKGAGAAGQGGERPR